MRADISIEIPERFCLGKPLQQRSYLVDGRIRHWKGPMQEVRSPLIMDEAGQGLLIGSYPLLGKKEALETLEAAVRAYDAGRGEWPAMPVEERVRAVRRFAKRMKEVREEAVRYMVWEIGKPVRDAEREFDRTVDYIHDTIAALQGLTRASGDFVADQGIVGRVSRSALGVVLCMGPFNYPLNETFTTLIPALIMGNTVIMKPPKHGVLLHSFFLDLFAEEFPPGVINTVYGDGRVVISPIISSGQIDVLAFIGSSQVADILKKQCPNPHRLRSVLGLEAKNPAIVLPGADLALAARECLLGSLTFNGQRCTALKLIYVHKDVVESFLDLYLALVDELKVALPWEKEVMITPLAEENKVEKMRELITDAVAKGARVMNEGGGEASGALMHPAVLYPVERDMRIFTEEQFGPIVPIVAYDRLEEVMEDVIASKYGQQLSIFGKDERIIGQLIDRFAYQVCRININCQCQRGPDIFPFSGRKDSAEGTLSVSDALRVFSIRTVVAVKDSEAGRKLFASLEKGEKSAYF
jgi:glyceraldehyde-3-phosphate dehydrogenase (NADP+)